MQEAEAKDWVKNRDNLKALLEKILKGIKPKENKYAIFMAGIPGAGKTELVSNSKSSAFKNIVIIEHDRLVEEIPGYKPEHYYEFRKAGSVLVTKIFEECLRQGLSFVLDGTLSHENGRRNIKKCIDKGYQVLIIYVYQDAQSAWNLTQERELVKKRAIEKSGFIHTCGIINERLLEIFRQFSANDLFTFWIIKKNGYPHFKKSELIIYDPKAHKETMAEIESILTKVYNTKHLRE